MRAIVFANGVVSQPQLLHEWIVPADLIVAADGGSRHCQEAGLTPQVIIGDFDSLSQAEILALETRGAKLICYPVRKDFTDLELALQYVRNQGATEILVFGALGRRWDQTLANLLLPAASSFNDVQIRLIDGSQEIMLLRSGDTLQVLGQPGDTLSLIPLGGDASNIHTEGLEYTLQNETLRFGATRGISNVLLAETARITLGEGLLLCVLIHGENPDS